MGHACIIMVEGGGGGRIDRACVLAPTPPVKQQGRGSDWGVCVPLRHTTGPPLSGQTMERPLRERQREEKGEKREKRQKSKREKTQRERDRDREKRQTERGTERDVEETARASERERQTEETEREETKERDGERQKRQREM